MSKKSVDVPEGLRELLQAFTVAVLRAKPANLIDFAVEYFEMKKNEQRENNDVESDEEVIAPPIGSRRRQGVAAESYDPEKEDKFEKVVHEKTEEQRQRLTNATKGILLFRCLDEDQMRDVIDAMFERKVEAGERVITFGEDGDNFYVIEEGNYDIIVKVKGVEKKVGQYNGSGSFGELALMYNTPRAATIQATTPGIVWVMTRDVFMKIVLKSAFNKRKMYEDLLNQVPILKSLSVYERTSIADALHTQIFEEGAKIISQGEEGEEMYFVEDGEVRITMKKSGCDEETELTRIKKGGYFGELALLTKSPRVASAYAATRTKLAVLDVGSFERLLGPCLEILQRNIDNYENQLKAVFGSLDNVPELRH
ncbi:unnamed protein product [Mesocestoides corti]|uniref:cAMP-dependent protein kinase type II regulatory subunit n=2 Tax=Mesocestoides corti TaxID=53468 RepID=A0A0R3UA67_MESCO|nr:unnamed protein product [Mesocestoides corti]